MMLFTREITKIAYDDVRAFCDKDIKENEAIEYKGDFPRDLEKTIIAFANTYGGIIIIGINDQDGHPMPPFDGIQFEDGLQERVTQIAINIYPPVFPEIQVCPPQNGKTFVVIRIAESNLTPHYNREKTIAYVRTGNIIKPERIADLNELEWLRNRRNKSLELRKSITDKAKEHFENICQLYNIKFGFSAKQSFSICPLFPSKLLVVPQEIEGILFQGTTRPYLFQSLAREHKSVENGFAIFEHISSDNKYKYLEINKFGLIFYQNSLDWELHLETDGSVPANIRMRYIYLSRILDHLIAFINFANYFFYRIGYFGLFRFNYSLFDILNLRINNYFESRPILGNGNSIIKELNISREFSAGKLTNMNDRTDIIFDLIEEIVWSLGSEIDPTPSVEANKLLKRYIAGFMQ